MKSTRAILTKRHLPVLGGFALSNVLLAFEYDGALAPFVDDPGRARIRADTRRLLTRVARCYPSVVISGRSRDDLASRLNGIPVWYLFGNHGIERAVAPGAPAHQETREWVRRLSQQLPDDPGIIVEDKTHSITIHYRRARDRRSTVAAIDRAVRLLPDARIVDGVESVHVVPRAGGHHRAMAVRHALHVFACDHAIYVGDDVPDDAFSVTAPERLLGIRIGAAGASHARYHIESQAEVDALLRALLQLRPAMPARRVRAGAGTRKDHAFSG